ncbi:MAG TPA: hypothetical protein VM240_10145 [Verrucomicrobiae bacterium]|nr:hypothetical protein [Verrucomicrobiae bacterium]
MALTIPCSTKSIASIDEYIDHIQSKVDLQDVDSLAGSAAMLRALSNDRALVVRELNNLIVNAVAYLQPTSAQTIVLGSGEGFYVRANLWPAISDMSNARAYQNQFAYNIAHDHNFTFMTVTHLGPGYETEIYEYDYERVEGYVGESVELQFLEKTRFTTGAVMMYRASRDAHVQHAPEDLTVTLNLMVATPGIPRDQYQFDLASRTIIAVGDVHAASRMSLINLAASVGDAQTLGLLHDVAAKHSCRQTRLAAYDALSLKVPAEAAEVWLQAARDPAPVVANAARKRLAKLDAG